MVRLKGGQLIETRGLGRTFQFHYGTIKRKFRIKSSGRLSAFQFHYGTIKRITPRLDYSQGNKISIPLWYD